MEIFWTIEGGRRGFLLGACERNCVIFTAEMQEVFCPLSRAASVFHIELFEVINFLPVIG